MVRVKLKEVLPGGAEQGLFRVLPIPLTALPFTIHCMLGHGSAVTTANNVTCPPTLDATNSGFPMILSIARRSEDEADTADIAEEEGENSCLAL